VTASTESAEFREVAEPQDWAALGRWLESRGMERGPAEPRQFAGGLANLNYLIEVDGRPVVLRRPPGGPLAEGASDKGREARVLGRLHEHYPLAPRSIAYCDDRGVLGAEFQLIEYRPGVTIRDRLPAAMDASPGIGSHLTRELVGAVAALHAIDPGAAGLGDLARRPERFLPRQVDGWERRARAAFGDGLPPAAGRIVEWLRGNQPPPGRVSLLHNDPKFDNGIFDPASAALRAVVDWDMSTLGDPLFDLGVCLSYWVEPGDPAELHGLGQAPSLLPGFPDRRELAAAYFQAAGRDEEPVGFHLALARFRLAVAWQQMYVLHQRGALAGPRYEGFHALAKLYLEWTADSLDAVAT
jgi:aminoglycoside phosphotransferase (APT) family kinase protein